MTHLTSFGNLFSYRLPMLVIFFVSYGFMLAPAFADVSAAEREALVALYDATKGDSWKDNSNWKTGDPCSWYGVICNSAAASQVSSVDAGGSPKAVTDTVVSLELFFNNLNGVIPPEIGDLTNLEELKIFRNQLNGTIPPEVGRLTKLTVFMVSNNMLDGPLPESIWDLNDLWSLQLCRNPMSNPISSGVAKLTKLTKICFGGGFDGDWDQRADLSAGLPDELFDLEQLDTLQIFTSTLTGPIPAGIGKLRNLTELTVFGSLMTGPIPDSLANLSSLSYLNLSRNQLSGEIPQFLGGLHTLRSLRLTGNKLTGEIPANWKDLTALTRLELGWNSLWSSDPTLDGFLDRTTGIDWSATQTLPPANIKILGSDDKTITLSWDDVEYKDAGHFRVWYATSSGGPWLDGGATVDKSALSLTVEGLLSGETYYFTVQTETDPHEENKNKVISDRSAEVSATTSGELAAFLINAGLNDAWFNPVTDGQGFFVTVFPDVGVVVLAWFTYDTELPSVDAIANLGDAGHRWLLAVGPFLNNEAILDIEMATGGIFDTASEITRVLDGSITLSFEGCNTGTVEYNISSIARQGSVPIQRVAKDNIVLCEILNEELNNNQ